MTPNRTKSLISLLFTASCFFPLIKAIINKIKAAEVIRICVNLKASKSASRNTFAATPPTAKQSAAVIKKNSARCFILESIADYIMIIKWLRS